MFVLGGGGERLLEIHGKVGEFPNQKFVDTLEREVLIFILQCGHESGMRYQAMRYEYV